MPETASSIRELVQRLDRGERTAKPTICVVVRGWSHYAQVGLTAVKRRWARLRIICDEAALRPHIEHGMIPDRDVSIHHAADPDEQLSLLQKWCASGEVDVLLRGDLTHSRIFHLLANPYHRQSIEDGISRACLLSVPGYPKPLTIIGAIGPEKPLFDQMVIHMKNGYHLARGLGIERPKIALLSAMDRVGIDDLHTYNCKCLVSMVHLEQIPDLDLEGPMSFDTAVDPRTVEHIDWSGPVAGQADIIIVDSHQTRSILTLTLTEFGHAQAARVVLGGRIPLAIVPPEASTVDGENALAVALTLAPYLRDARPLNWLTDTDPIDYAW